MSLPIPPDFHALVVRTDFTDDAAWHEVCRRIEWFDCEGYKPTLLRVEDQAYDRAILEDLLRSPGPYYAFVVDSRTIADPTSRRGRFALSPLRCVRSTPILASPTWTSRSSPTRWTPTACSEASPSSPSGVGRIPDVARSPIFVEFRFNV